MSEARDLLERALSAKRLGYPLPFSIHKAIQEYLEKPEQEPVAWISYGMYTTVQDGRGWEILCATKHKCSTDDVAVYLHAEQPERKPLSDGEINKIALSVNPWNGYEFARAIEKAHGIVNKEGADV